MDQISCTDSAISTCKVMTDKPTSMSSLSFESAAGGASTSGCSSLLDPNQQKYLKKQRVKKCLAELKTLVKPARGRGKNGTLDTLESILHQMRTYKKDAGDPGSNATEMIDSELMGSIKDGDAIDWPLSYGQTMDRGNWFRVVLSQKENVVLQVPQELLRMLRYPNNYWFNQSLMDYIYKKDVVTVNTQLAMARNLPKPVAATSANESPGAPEQKNIFFFRIRHYKSIRHGFSLNRSEKYTVFCGQASRQKVQLNFPPGTPVEGLQADHNYPVLEFTPINSAYSVPGVLPSPPTFLMRHTVHCNYIFLHPSSIPLTGYLPQEVIGTSIFEYYHPQDLLILLGIYQQIVAVPGKTFRSVPYRMRVKNGDYIRIETEWSSFVNPWTNRIDFIICKNTVLSGPTNLDIFTESSSGKRQNQQEVSPQARSLQRHIRATLLQSFDRSFRPSSYHRRRTVQQPQPEAESATLTQSQKLTQIQKESNDMSSDELASNPSTPLKQVEAATVDDQSDLTCSSNILENEKLVIYEQLNYAQNIRRFLMSCSASAQGKSSSENTDNTESNASDQEDITVDLSLPKPPSFASSTKALVSEREQLEEMPPSPTNEDLPDLSSTSTGDDVYKPILLTEEVISLHNRQQRAQYIEKMVREKTGVVMAQGQGLRIIKENRKGKKRSHPKEREDGAHVAKTSRKELLSSKWNQTDPSQLLYPQMTPEEAQVASGSVAAVGATTNPQPETPTVMSVSAPQFVPISTTVGSGLMLCQNLTTGKPQLVTVQNNLNVSQQQHMLYATSANNTVAQWPSVAIGTQNIQAARYPVQIVYQPIPEDYFCPINAQPMMGQTLNMVPSVPAAQGAPSKHSSSETEESLSMGSKEIAEKDEAGKMVEKKLTGEGSDSQSLEDTTSSSMLYLLESAHNSSTFSESDDAQNKSVNMPKKTAPPWKMIVQWNTQLEMNFQMPQVNVQQVMKADRMFLQKMRQTPLVMEQVQELVSQPTSAECVLLDDDNLLSSRGKPQRKTAEEGAQQKEQKQQQQTVDVDEGSGSGAGSPASAPSSDPDSLDGKDKKLGSDSDTSEGAMSKESSDITASDQRSHDDASSSVKESDQASTDSGQSPVPKEVKTSQTLTPEEVLTKVFVPMRYERQRLSKSAWLQNTQFDKQVQMQYNRPQTSDVGKLLANDQAQLESMDQPQMVHTQLEELLVQLKSQVTQALTPVDPKDSMDVDNNSDRAPSTSSMSSEGKVFPYSSTDSDSANADPLLKMDTGGDEPDTVSKDSGDRMDHDPGRIAQTSSSIDSSPGNSLAILSSMRNNQEGGIHSEMTDVLTDPSTTYGSCEPSSGQRSADNGSTGTEVRLFSSSDEEGVAKVETPLPLCRDTLPIASSPSSHEGNQSMQSDVQSVSSIPSCCSPKVLIEEIESNRKDMQHQQHEQPQQQQAAAAATAAVEAETKVQQQQQQQEGKSKKDSAVMMMKDLFTSDHAQVVIPE